MDHSLELLVIDDDTFDRLHLQRALKESGIAFRMTECAEVSALWERLAERDFDCIFLDYLLPGANGLALLKKIREKEVLTPVVIITSQGSEHIAVELMKAGASDYIVKNDINGLMLAQVLRNMARLKMVITEKDQAEKALRVSESKLAHAQRIAKIGSWEAEGDNIIYWSTQLFRILGVDEKRFTPTKDAFLLLVNPDDRQPVAAAWNEVWSAGQAMNVDFRISTPEGEKYVNAQGHAMTGDHANITRVVGTLQDITERKLAEQEVLRTRELAENSMKVREIFLANMSHEIRTPMNAILGFTRLLFQTDLTKEQKGFIDAIHFSGENLLVIINDILDLTKIRSGKMVIDKCEFNVRDLVAGIVSVLRLKAKEKGLDIMTHICDNVPRVIIGDPVRVNQILTNLITNAIKFTEKGMVTVDIELTSHVNQDLVIEFKVSDTGIGIPEDKLATIFNDFVQASGDTTRKYGGTGLGLAIVRNLVELQEGKIKVSSVPGTGSTFTVHLPFEKVNAVQGMKVSQPVAADEGDQAHLLRGASVLVVEDNAVNQLLLKKVLEKAGCNVDIGSNGREAVELAALKQYDVILMDVQMPEMDGHEATQQIRTKLKAPLSSTPIIALTAHAFGADVARCMAAGMNDYLSKPFNPHDLCAKIARYLRVEDSKVVPINPATGQIRQAISVDSIYQLSNGDMDFVNELVLIFDKQTPAFVERLRGYTKSQNFNAMCGICQQIKSSYGILGLRELEDALDEVGALLKSEKPESEMARVTTLVNEIIALISAINEELKRSLRKTG